MTRQATPARTCAYCGNQFVPSWKEWQVQRYCSFECLENGVALKKETAELPLPEPPDKP